MSGTNRLIKNRNVGKSTSVLSENLLNANEVAKKEAPKKKESGK